jgi:CRISPR-associated protein Csd1
MILQSLVEYYNRKSELGEIAPVGFEEKSIPFIILINGNGDFIDLVETWEPEDKKKIAKTYLVPKSKVKTGSNSWMTCNFLWEHWGYILGYPKGDSEKDRKKRELMSEQLGSELFPESFFLGILSLEKIDESLTNLSEIEKSKAKDDLIKNLKGLKKAVEDSRKQMGTFINSINELPEPIKEEAEIKAIISFYKNEEYKKVYLHHNWNNCCSVNGANMTFQLLGDTEIVPAKPYIRELQKELFLSSESEEKPALCLVTGEDDYIERIHAATPIGGQAFTKLVGFQKNSGFDSYGKEQAYNAPIGKKAQFAYTTALNTLTKKNRVIIGDTTMVYWAEKENSLENNFEFLFTKPKDDPDRSIGAVKALYESIKTGKLNTEETTRFYILGIAPNSARVCVRYWLSGSVLDFSRNIKQHFDDLEIVRSNKDDEYFTLGTLLSHTVLDFKVSNVPPNQSAQVVEAALKGSLYPQSLLHSTIRRIRAEQRITRVRAAIIKACLNRSNRFYHREEEITVALDVTNNNPAYLLGRLFAVLERIQSRALNVETIRERYYGAFSSTPVTVYPQLMKLKNHHLAKLDGGLKHYYEKLIGEIIDGLDGSGKVPRQFSLDEQGRFAIGYYHQRQDFFKKKNDGISNSEENDK